MPPANPQTATHAPIHELAPLAELLLHGPALVLSGAGMSTDSGIPDYRGPDGTRRVRPMEHGEFVGSSAARQRYWARSYVGWTRFAAAEPNAGHVALARLQGQGLVGPIITQNVDGLHQRAGSTDVVELHGSLAEVQCLRCGIRVGREVVQAAMAAGNPGFVARATGVSADGSRVSSQIRPDGDIVLGDALVLDFVAPTCPGCGADTLKPDVVFFGGTVPAPLVEHCYALTDAAPALLVLGSSLAVMSGLRFVRRAAGFGIPIGILTRGPTRGDQLATVRVDGPLTESLVALAGALA